MSLTTLIVVVFLAFFAANLAVELALEALNLRHVAAAGPAVPEALRGHVSPETALRAQDYTLAKGRLGIVHGLYGAVLTLVLLFSGVLPWLDGLLAGWGLAGAHRFAAFLVALTAITGLANLPFAVYRTFRLEQRFGFNRQTWGMWLVDRIKGLAVGAAIGVPLLYGVYGFMAYTGGWWWLWLFAFLTAFQIVMVWLYPTLIAPLFNKFEPLPEGELKQRVSALAERAGFHPRGLYVMDASRRSGHSNAYFTGFFRPRIVLFDTLLKQTDTDQTLAVLAHEIGHYTARHVHKRIALNLGGMLVALYVLSLLIDWPPLFAAFGFAGPSYHAALALLMLGGGVFTFFLEPVASWLSRRHEFEADAISVRLTALPEALKTALLRLNDENLANLHPHPWYSRYHYSHPPLVERLAAIDARAQGAAGAAAVQAAS